MESGDHLEHDQSLCERCAKVREPRHNKSLDASGGSVFLNLFGATEGALVRAAASTPRSAAPLCGRIVSMVAYRPVQTDDYESLQKFLADNGWAVRVGDIERFRAMLDGADRTVVALDGVRVVGFARALCDGVSNGYISMVAVAKDLRRQGIGRRMVEQLMHGDTGGDITWVLRAGRGSRGFWERVGFTASEIAMERVRRG